jgi:hypothetical protein
MSVMTTWHPVTHGDYDILKGLEVFSADGDKIGAVSEILHPNLEMPAARGKHYFLLDPGLIKDWFGGFNQVYLSEAAIAEVGPNRISLSMTSEQVKQHGQEWTTEPSGLKGYRRV